MAVLADNAVGAKYAYTGWQVLERYGNFTYIACKLKPAARTRFACIWHLQGTRWRGMPFTARKTASNR